MFNIEIIYIYGFLIDMHFNGKYINILLKYPAFCVNFGRHTSFSYLKCYRNDFLWYVNQRDAENKGFLPLEFLINGFEIKRIAAKF